MPAFFFIIMKRAKQAFKFITNKYVIAVSVFVVMMFFFDDNNIFIQLDRKRQLNELLTKQKYYEDKIKATSEELKNLQSNPAAVEKFVRENYLMKSDNEDVFVVESGGQASDKK